MTTALAIPHGPDSITAAWLTEALKIRGALKDAVVLSFTKKPIGEDESFTGGTLTQVEIEYSSPEPKAPRSLVVKLSPTDPEILEALKGNYRREGHFYTEFAAKENLPIPHCYYGDFDIETGEGILLLEDLSHYRLVEFVAGCVPQDVEKVMRALATIHVQGWNSPQLKEMSGAEILTDFPFAELWSQYPQKATALLPELPLPDSFLAIGQYVADNALSIFERLSEADPLTCIHRDIHVDNVLFGVREGDIPAIILDWQAAGRGKGVYDVAYFIISSVSPVQRRQTEKELLRFYHTLLVKNGIENYSFAQCWFDYRLSVVGKLFVTVIATVLVDNSTPFKQAWRQADLQRLLAFCEDHEIQKFLFSLDTG
jgi:thiamine kinase-like enzyme